MYIYLKLSDQIFSMAPYSLLLKLIFTSNEDEIVKIVVEPLTLNHNLITIPP